MKHETFLDVLNEVDESLLARCDADRGASVKRFWKPFTAIAAAFAVALIGTLARYPVSAPAEGGMGGGDAQGDGWMQYVGPVLPLTALDDPAGLVAQRHIDYDFSPYISYGDSYTAASQITDRYTLTNTSAEDRTVTLAYPFSGRLLDEAIHLPQITVDGKVMEITYYPGPYSGGYSGLSPQDGGAYNLSELTSFDGYRALLEEGDYLSRVWDDFPVLDQPVTVYRITEPQAVGNARTIAMEFTVDPGKTTVLSHGFGGYLDDPETGRTVRQLTIPLPGKYETREVFYVILLGEDIGDYTLQGYQNGSLAPEMMAEATATVTRYETTLGELMLQIIADERQSFQKSWYHDPEAAILIDDVTLSDAQYLGLAAELMTDAGFLSDNVIGRYPARALQDIFMDVLAHPRLLYLTFEVTVPAGGSITVESTLLRAPHRDLDGRAGRGDGYDMATALGSALTFTAQTASVSNTDVVRIVRQNFGFDPAKGITEVTLDLDTAHYWMEVHRVRVESEE